MYEHNRVLIDDHGHVCASPVQPEHAHFLLAPGDPKAFEFAVRNLGYVGLQLGEGRARVWLSETTAARRAVLVVRDSLRRHQPARTVLSLMGRDSEQNRLVAGWQRACTALMAAASGMDVRRPDPHLAQTREIEAVRKFPILEQAYRAWHNKADAVLFQRLLPLLECTPGVRFVLAECATENGTSIIREMGGAFTAFEQTWLRMAGGLRVQDQPDYAYGLWIANTYARVATSGFAAIDDVDVEVTRPRTGLIRSRYRRLLLPIATRRPNSVGVLSVNLIDRTIDLRKSKTG